MLNAYLWTLVIASYVTTVLYAYDKKLVDDAIINRTSPIRLCEFYVLIATALGGAFGAIVGMVLFDHKSNMSRKWYYLVMIISATMVQTFILLLLLGVIKV